MTNSEAKLLVKLKHPDPHKDYPAFIDSMPDSVYIEYIRSKPGVWTPYSRACHALYLLEKYYELD